MSRKSVVAVIVIAILSIAYFLNVYITVNNDRVLEKTNRTNNKGISDDSNNLYTTEISNRYNNTNENNDSFISLNIKLIEISNTNNEKMAEIDFEQQSQLYVEQDYITGTNVFIKKIDKLHVIVTYQDIDYILQLEQAVINMSEKSLVNDVDNVTSSSKQKKLRPHITRPTNFDQVLTILPGNKVSVGLSQQLFSDAGFLKGDQLLTVNNTDINDDIAFSKLIQNITELDTLIFEVDRNGKRIVLYLDIPSESLSIN